MAVAKANQLFLKIKKLKKILASFLFCYPADRRPHPY